MSSGSGSAEAIAIETVYENEEIESSVEPPREEWSSLACICAPVINFKRELYAQGLYEIGSGEICTKYIAQSDSSVFRHPYYNYPAVIDPGIEKCLLQPEEKVEYSDDGQALYLAICKDMGQCPVRIFHNSLLNDAINLRYYGVNPNGVRAMAMALQYNKFVTVLDLTDNFLNNDACYHLGDMLTKNSTLKKLIMESCRIEPEGARRLFACLTVNRGLEHLNLNRNQLTDVGGEYFANAVVQGLDLKEVYLSYNNLGSKTAAALADAFEFQNKLTHLDLSWNNFFSPFGTCNVLNRLEDNIYLQELNLAWNSLAGPRIGYSLKNVLMAPNLNHLDLSNNKLTGDVVAIFLVNLGKAKKLVTLNLSNNPLGTSDALAVINKMKSPAVKVQNLFMDNISVNAPFLVELDDIQKMKSKKNTVITHGDVFGTFKAVGKDPRELVLNRAEYLAQKPKRNKADIALIVMQLSKDKFEMMDTKAFGSAVKNAGAILDDDLVEEIANAFPGPKSKKSKSVNIDILVDYVKRKWPDRQLPATPPPEPEPIPLPTKKGKGKGKKK